MYTRLYGLPGHSFFLFGPRGTGKTTWLRQVLPDALWFDLLRTEVLLSLARRPESLRQQVLARTKGDWIVVDEIQRLPVLLNEVQSLMTDFGSDYRFALSGSSARKLKRADANLLAGRAINRSFFPLSAAELNFDFDVDDVLRFGLLPKIRAEPAFRIESLDAYAANYIREEVQQEALVRNLDSFVRFLEVAAVMNGQTVNESGIARDAAVARPTVQGYFATLVDTLIGVRLPAWRRRLKVKEVAASKFYLFDPGVVRALAGRLREPLDGTERGFLLETWILHELRVAMARHNTGGELSYWKTSGGGEVDFIWNRADLVVGFEVKASDQWRREYGAALKMLIEERHISRGYGVYNGKDELKDGAIWVLPLRRFLEEVTRGSVFG